MPDDLPDAGSTLPAAVPTPIPPPISKKRRRELSNAQRAEMASLERDMKALQMTNSRQTTLERWIDRPE